MKERIEALEKEVENLSLICRQLVGVIEQIQVGFQNQSKINQLMIDANLANTESIGKLANVLGTVI